MILHVILLHIVVRVTAAGAVDALPVQASLGIELQVAVHIVGELLCYLPVGMPIGRLVATVGDRRFLACGMLHGGVLPAIGVLQLEVGIALEATDVEPYAVMLTNIAIRPHA